MEEISTVWYFTMAYAQSFGLESIIKSDLEPELQ